MSRPTNGGWLVSLTSTFCSESLVWDKSHTVGHFLTWRMSTIKSTTWIAGKCASDVLLGLVKGKRGPHLLIRGAWTGGPRWRDRLWGFHL